MAINICFCRQSGYNQISSQVICLYIYVVKNKSVIKIKLAKISYTKTNFPSDTTLKLGVIFNQNQDKI